MPGEPDQTDVSTTVSPRFKYSCNQPDMDLYDQQDGGFDNEQPTYNVSIMYHCVVNTYA